MELSAETGSLAQSMFERMGQQMRIIKRLDKAEPSSQGTHTASGSSDYYTGGTGRSIGSSTAHVYKDKKELKRELTMFNNLACCLSALSIFTLADSYGSIGLTYGGPVVVLWGWCFVSLFSLCMSLSLAELLSAYPTSGGLYYWSWILAPRKYRTLVCWVVGWVNLLGQVAFTASTEYALLDNLSTLILLHTGSAQGGGYTLTNNQSFGLFVLIIVMHCLMNSINQSFLALCISMSGLWHVIATAGFCLTLLVVAPQHQSASYVFGHWQKNEDIHGITSTPYIAMVGLLMSSWTIMGYDASIHMCEETIAAEYAAPRAIVSSVGGCSLIGFGLLLTLTFSTQSPDNILDPDAAAGQGHAIAQVTWDVFFARYGSGLGALPLLYVPFIALFLCSFCAVTANSRMLYAFSRDGAMLGSRFWKHLHPVSKLPLAGTWVMGLLALLIALPAFYNQSTFNAISAVSVVALSLSYGAPIFLKLFHDQRTFVPGPFNLGRWSRPIGIMSCTYILFITVIFVLPMGFPVTAENMNYASVMLVAVLLLSLALWYAPRIGGSNWFHGPIPNPTPQLAK